MTMMNRRTFSAALLASAAATVNSAATIAAPATNVTARNVVFVHGLFADGSCWSEVIDRMQAQGMRCTSVQNPLTTLTEAVAAVQRVLKRQDGPTVLVAHSFAGMIVTEAGDHPIVSALVYVATRSPDAGEDYPALANTYMMPPASAGILFDDDEGLLSERAFMRDFAGDIPQERARVLYAVQQPLRKALLRARPRKRLGVPNRVFMRFQRRIARLIPICSVSWQSAWAPRRLTWRQATCHSSRNPT